MSSIFWFSLALLPCLSLTEYCGSYSDGEFCDPEDYQVSYCCGYDDRRCCYYTDVADLWWFWFLLVFLLIFFVIMIIVICRRRQLQRGRLGYVVVRGQNVVRGTVITRNEGHIAQVAPSGTIYTPYYAGAPYQGYQDPVHGGESTYGHPPPYAPPNAPLNDTPNDTQGDPKKF